MDTSQHDAGNLDEILVTVRIGALDTKDLDDVGNNPNCNLMSILWTPFLPVILSVVSDALEIKMERYQTLII